MSKKSKKKNSKKTNRPVVQLTPAKKRLFTMITVAIPILFFVILEACLQLFQYGGNTRLFITTPEKDSPYYGINTNVARRYFYMDDFVPTPRKDLFLKEKPKESFRIFVLGGSTTAGFPYGNNVTFPRILQRRLADIFPEKRIEVVNTAMTAICSYTQLDFMDEILAQKPDAILIYSGHNEYYGALGIASMESFGKQNWFVRLYLRLNRLKIFVLIRDGIGKLRKLFHADSDESKTFDPMKTVMARIVKDRDIEYGSKTYRAGKEQFKKNMSSIIHKAGKANIPVFFSELVSNVRDQAPFVSIKSGHYEPAQTVFVTARNLEKQGNRSRAREEYYRAKDLDALRFRAPEEFNEIIHNLATRFNIPVVPMKSVFEAASPNGIIGRNLMHEHLHPNIDGYFLMADAFLNTMKNNHLISSQWPEQNIKPTEFYRQNWGFTKLDSTYAALTVLHLKGGWPFKPAGVPNTILFDYKAKTAEETLSLYILKTANSTLEMGHIELAKKFYAAGNVEKALDEYKALIYTIPTLDIFYEPVIKVLVEKEQYERAMAILFDALKFQRSAYVYKWIGQIYLVNNFTEKGIAFLEASDKLESKDPDVLFNLTRAFYKLSQFSKGDSYLERLKKLGAGSQAIQTLQEFKLSVQNAANEQ